MTQPLEIIVALEPSQQIKNTWNGENTRKPQMIFYCDEMLDGYILDIASWWRL